MICKIPKNISSGQALIENSPPIIAQPDSTTQDLSNYNSDEFEHNIDDPDPVVESSEGYEDLETPMNIPPPPQQTIDLSAENEINNSQNEEANVNDTADDKSDGDEDGLVFSSFSSTGRHQNSNFSNNINIRYQ